jgi:predicted small metal-binding protein
MRLRCPCGEVIEAETEDEIVEKANEHLTAEHPALAGTYTRDEILFLTY